MPINNNGEEARKRLGNIAFQTPKVLEHAGRAALGAGSVLGLGTSYATDYLNKGIEYLTGIGLPKTVPSAKAADREVWGLDDKKKKKKIPAPAVPAMPAAPTTSVTPRPELATAPPLYTNIPQRLSEPGAIPFPSGLSGNRRFSNVGSFNAGKTSTPPPVVGPPPSAEYAPLSTEEYAKRGARSGLTGPQYAELHESGFAHRQRALEIEGERGRQARLTQAAKPTYEIGTTEVPSPETSTGSRKRAFTFDPYTGKTVPVNLPEEAGAEAGGILKVEDFMKLDDEKRKAYMDKLKTENPNEFMRLYEEIKKLTQSKS